LSLRLCRGRLLFAIEKEEYKIRDMNRRGETCV